MAMKINPNKFTCIRKSKNICQEEIASKLGIKKPNVSNWERGTKAVPVKYHYAICQILGVSFEELCREYREPVAPSRGGGYVLTSPQPSITITVK